MIGRSRGSRWQCDEASVIHNVCDPWTVDSRVRREDGEGKESEDRERKKRVLRVEKEKRNVGSTSLPRASVHLAERNACLLFSPVGLSSAFKGEAVNARAAAGAHRMPNAECRWKLQRINEYIFQLGGGLAEWTHPVGYKCCWPILAIRFEMFEGPKLSFDIYIFHWRFRCLVQ